MSSQNEPISKSSANVPSIVILDTLTTLPTDQSNRDNRPLSASDISTNTIASVVHELTKQNSNVASFFPEYVRRLRSISALPDLVDALIKRYNSPPPNFILREDLEEWNEDTSINIRLRVMNIIMTWIKQHWLPGIDDIVLPALKTLIYQCMAELSPLLDDHIKDIVQTRIRSIEKVINRKRGLSSSVHVVSMLMVSFSSAAVHQIHSGKLVTLLSERDYTNISILDFKAVQLAEQLTIMESNLYCTIRPDEMLHENFGLSSSVRAINLLNSQITNWISESILNEDQSEKRKQLIEFILKVADVCMQLYNFSTSSSILAAFETPIISRLKQTFFGLQETSKLQLESLKALLNTSENHIEYRRRLRDTVPPAVPCLGLYIADATFCRESYRGSDLNERDKLFSFRKYCKFAQILQEMQRFQTPYHLTVIPEVQEYLGYTLDKIKVANVPSLPPKIDLKSFRSSLSLTSTSKTISVYSKASSRTVSTDYGTFYTRHAISQDLDLLGYEVVPV